MLQKFQRLLILGCLLTCCANLTAESSDDLLKTVFAEGISVDLREPTFSDGTFTTNKGGVITAPGLRIQAQHIVYTRKMSDCGEPIFNLTAEGDLMVNYGEYIFVGEKMIYDFQDKTGTIYTARTGIEPWFFGGAVIRLNTDGSYAAESGFITTDENICSDWKISVEAASLTEERFLKAEHIKFQFQHRSYFWLPYLKFDLDSIFDSPISYYVKWGGREGPRAGLSYEFISWNRFSAFLRLDYRINRGPGGGFETWYRSLDHKTFCQTINYVARDNSVYLPRERFRYRFEGAFSTLLYNDTVSIDLTYDKLSDQDMATDYDDNGLELETAGRTQLDINRQDRNWIANLYTRLRVNSFETVKEELPSFLHSWRPFALWNTGIISQNQIKLSYLDFAYATHSHNSHDYSASRFAFSHLLYRPFTMNSITVTPEAGTNAIFYSNGPHGEDAKWLVLGALGCEVTAPFYKFYEHGKHVMEPYASYHYYSSPTISPHQHYIFDIDDGWVRLNMMRFGTRHSLYKKTCDGNISRYLYQDLYANAFFDIPTIPQTIPKVYSRTTWRPNEFLKYTLGTAWDLEMHQLDHFNIRAEWTANADFAISTEYRHRSAYDWRKADRDNFMLDAFHTINELKHSTVSDRRDTFLLHMFYRFYPNWAIECESRQGWNRKRQRAYSEFELDLLTTVYSAGNVRLSYQHREGEDRVAIYFSVGLKRPDSCDETFIPNIDF